MLQPLAGAAETEQEPVLGRVVSAVWWQSPTDREVR